MGWWGGGAVGWWCGGVVGWGVVGLWGGGKEGAEKRCKECRVEGEEVVSSMGVIDSSRKHNFPCKIMQEDRTGSHQSS